MIPKQPLSVYSQSCRLSIGEAGESVLQTSQMSGEIRLFLSHEMNFNYKFLQMLTHLQLYCAILGSCVINVNVFCGLCTHYSLWFCRDSAYCNVTIGQYGFFIASFTIKCQVCHGPKSTKHSYFLE